MGLFDANTYTITLVAVTCYKCGVIFGIESNRQDRLEKSHESFWCPNGHSQAYVSKTVEEKRIEELEREARTLKVSRDSWRDQATTAREEVQHQGRRINGYKGLVARTKRKIAAGRCPCCSHQFKDLERHMQTQHPKWNPEQGAAALAQKE